MRQVALMLPCAAVLAWSGSVNAADFRIISQVYAGNAKQPASSTLTLFRAGVVYDYLSQPETVTVFDPLHGRFVMLDPVEQIQCEIPTREVASFNDELKLRASGSKDPLLQFMANPQFRTSTPQPEIVHLSSQFMTYRIQVQRVTDAAAIRQYVEFSDWYARLNTLMNPGSPPPFTRMAINQVLLERGEIPREVLLTVRPAQQLPNGREVQLRSTHEVSWKLLADDMRRIEKTGEQLATYELVSLDDFQQAGQKEMPKAAVVDQSGRRNASPAAVKRR